MWERFLQVESKHMSSGISTLRFISVEVRHFLEKICLFLENKSAFILDTVVLASFRKWPTFNNRWIIIWFALILWWKFLHQSSSTCDIALQQPTLQFSFSCFPYFKLKFYMVTSMCHHHVSIFHEFTFLWAHFGIKGLERNEHPPKEHALQFYSVPKDWHKICSNMDDNQHCEW